jgi:hypothetical protein
MYVCTFVYMDMNAFASGMICIYVYIYIYIYIYQMHVRHKYTVKGKGILTVECTHLHDADARDWHACM